MDESLGRRLRALRSEASMSLSELSRRSGIGKGTISELENDRRGARLDTLFALTTAIGAPLGALLPERTAPSQQIVGASVTATLVDRWALDGGLVEIYRATVASDLQESSAHAAGIEETVTVIRGRVLIGPVEDPRELGEGESRRYAGDVPHQFRALGEPAQVVLLMHYPPHFDPKGHDHDV